MAQRPLTDRQRAVLDHLRAHPGSSPGEVANALSLTPAQVRPTLKSLETRNEVHSSDGQWSTTEPSVVEAVERTLAAASGIPTAAVTGGALVLDDARATLDKTVDHVEEAIEETMERLDETASAVGRSVKGRRARIKEELSDTKAARRRLLDEAERLQHGVERQVKALLAEAKQLDKRAGKLKKRLKK